ncbi:MAG: SDR family NAD(P)-dependent oxidoreductase [Synechococcus sp.]
MTHVLVTGASSGIGLEAARSWAAAGHRITALCRNAERCEQTRQWLLAAGGAPERLDCIPADLADLASVEQACQQLLAQGIPIESLVLNAGQQRAGARVPQRSVQGVEITFAVNQLAHQWIASRLLPLLYQAKQPRLVITASDVHNPATGGGRVGRPAGLGDLAGLRSGASFVMVDGSDRFDGDKAYKDSKLCNVLLGRELSRQLGAAMPVITWSPGLVIPRSRGGFFRHNRQSNPVAMALFALLARDLFRVTESVQTAGGLLAQLAIDAAFHQPGFAYFSNSLVRPGLHRFASVATSAEGADLAKATELWSLSDQLIRAALFS